MNNKNRFPRQPTTLGLLPSFGFGDRIGLATPGHVAAMRRAGQGMAPIFPQQSIREMTRTKRSPEQVMQDACQAAETTGWSQPFGADADHLKTPEDVDRTAAAGFTFFTIDPSGHVDQQADDYDDATLHEQFNKIQDDVPWLEEYRGKEVKLDTGTVVRFEPQMLLRAAVKYGRAIRGAIKLSDYIQQVHETQGRDYEIELSVDETEQPTTLAEHYLIADQCLQHGMKLVSLAPRFLGDMEKGVDYLGDLRLLEKSLRDHGAIAEQLGPYKLSLHSGSDKLSMYPAFARGSRGRFHVKTAGTSYLEALRVVAIHATDLFRDICNFARDRYAADKATYHVHATLAEVPAPQEVSDDHRLLQIYLECWNDVPTGRGFTEAGRQILHCTFGSVLTHSEFGPAVVECLSQNPDTYTEVLTEHFARHLDALQEGFQTI